MTRNPWLHDICILSVYLLQTKNKIQYLKG